VVPISRPGGRPGTFLGGRYLTAGSLVALAVGLGLGIVLHGSGAPAVESVATALKWAGRIWIIALQFSVLPLVLTQAALAVFKTDGLGRLGAKSFALFVALLVLAAGFTLLVAPAVISLYRVNPATIAAIRSAVTLPESLAASSAGGLSLFDWIRGYIPTGVGVLFQGANLLLALLAAILIALVARRLAGRRREQLTRNTEAVAEVAMRVVGWILRFTPIAVLALSFGLGRGAGLAAAGLITFYVLVSSGMMLAVTLLLYPLTTAMSRVPVRRFARGAAPAQLVAMSTRSSLVSLPALVEGARDRLGLPVAATGFVLPLAVSTFKLSLAVSHPVMLVFIAHVFGVPLGTGAIVIFAGTMLLISFATPGIPGGNPGVPTLPAFLAAGVPAEGVLILDAVDAIPDIFKTVLNVTADLSVATIVTGAPARVSPPQQ